jgi:hypothetical protein
VAWVGLTEDQAKAQGIKVKKGLFPWTASGRAIANGRRRILGAFVGRGLIEKADAKDMMAYQYSGFSVDAGVCIEADDRAALERLLRYCARPTFAMDRLRREATSRANGKWRGLGIATFLEWPGGNAFEERVTMMILADVTIQPPVPEAETPGLPLNFSP